MRERGKKGRFHAGEIMGAVRGQKGRWIGDAATPLEDECYGS